MTIKKPEEYKKVMCIVLQKTGKCTYGLKCFKAHGVEELRGKHESLEDFLVEHRARNPQVSDYVVARAPHQPSLESARSDESDMPQP